MKSFLTPAVIFLKNSFCRMTDIEHPSQINRYAVSVFICF